MKLINKNEYSIMYGYTEKDFLKAGDVKEIEDKAVIEALLNYPNVEEYVDKEDIKKIEEENKKLKEELAKKEETKKETKKAKK